MFALSPPQSSRRGSVMSDADLNAIVNKDEYVEGNITRITYKKDRPGNDLFDCGHEVMCVKFTPDGSLIAAGLSDGTIKFVNPESGQCVYSLSDQETTTKKLPVTNIRFPSAPSPDGKIEHGHYMIATYASGYIKQWHYTSSGGQPALWTIDENRQTLVGAYNRAGNLFITGGADPVINVYDIETKTQVLNLEASDSRYQMNGHRARVFALQYHPLMPHVFISGGWDDTVQFWDDRQRHAVRKLYGPHICGDGLDIDEKHNHILTSSWRKEEPLQIWDFNSGELIKTVPQDMLHKSLLYCGQWLGRENIVCGGCDHNMVRVIDRGTLNTVGQLVDLPAGVFCIDNDRQQRPRVAVGSATKIWLLKLEKRN